MVKTLNLILHRCKLKTDIIIRVNRRFIFVKLYATFYLGLSSDLVAFIKLTLVARFPYMPCQHSSGSGAKDLAK